MLNISTSIEPKNFSVFDVDSKTHKRQYKEVKSGMLQSWNKFCFTGGIVEFSAKLPGSPSIGGLWPAIWMMGNLARATYVNSSEFMWPFSTNVCDNQTRNSQLINSCPESRNANYHMPINRGRGAPEIDLLEIMYMDVFEHPLLSASLQVAPGIQNNRPIPGQAPNSVSKCTGVFCHRHSVTSRHHHGINCRQSMTWYDEIEYGNASSLNTYFYGTTVWQKQHPAYQTDAISANIYVNDDHFYRQHTYRVEWEPPNEDGTGGYLSWFMDRQLISTVHGSSLQHTSHAEIPSEPMYLIMNTAISKDWGFPDAWFLDCKCKCWSCFDPCCATCALPSGYCSNFPAFFEIDYVRVYQATDDSKHFLGCSPPSRPTKEFIAARQDRYKLPDQVQPLKPVLAGGGSCTTNGSDCGTLERGMCSSKGLCICIALWTGPHCLAHVGGYDDDPSKSVQNFYVES